MVTLFCGRAKSTLKSVGHTTSSEMETHKPLSVRAGRSTNSSELRVQQDSVLAKYIDRFRHGRPQSREERKQGPSDNGEKQQPFWWMSPSSSPCSSTPTKTTDKDGIQPLKYDHGFAIFSPDGHRHDRSLSPCRRSLSMLSDASQGEFDDTEIQHLQEKASRLLLKGECTQSDGSNPVSSEGLETSDFSSPVSVYEHVRRPFLPIETRVSEKISSDSVQTMFCQSSSVLPFVVPPTRREEDILFQWRLRRKIEQAREGSQSLQHSSLHDPTSNWPAPSSSRLSASGAAYNQQQPPEFSQQSSQPHIIAPRPQINEAPRSCPHAADPSPFPAFVVSSSSVSQPKAIAQVPAHMHLLCDVLPCPLQSSLASIHQHLSEDIDESQTKVVCEKTQMPGNSIHNFTKERDCEHTPSLPSSGAMGRAQLIHHSRSEGEREEESQTRESEAKKAPSFGKQKKSTRCTAQRESVDGPAATNRRFSYKTVSKTVVQKAEQRQPEGSQGFSRGSSAGDHVPPTSPIHSALGQVVSEVLFPTVDPSPGLKSPVLSVSAPCGASEPPQSSVPPATAHNSMEVISQLLQEAEDSDEKEFEDDPLLQVLRRQRKWVKKRISDVDSMLNEFLEE